MTATTENNIQKEAVMQSDEISLLIREGHGLIVSGDYNTNSWSLRIMSALAAERDRADQAEARISLIRHRYGNWDGKDSGLFHLLDAIDIAIASKDDETTA
jgi:hypothetical protein